MKYSEKLKDPRWQKKRLEIFERDEWFCRKCGDDKATLAVHHKQYLPKTEPWDYPDVLLITLCEDCHNQEFLQRKEAEEELLNTLKEKDYFHDDVWALSILLSELKMPYPANVIIDILRWLLIEGVGMKTICDQYFKHLADERKKRESVGENKNDKA